MSYNYYNHTRFGIDELVLNLKNKLTSNLWNNNGYTAYGMAELKEENGYKVPVVYNSGINYSKVFPFPATTITEGLANEINAISYFLPISSLSGEMKTESEIGLYFSIKLNEIYPNITTYRAVENSIHEIMPIIFLSDFSIKNIYRNEEALSDFDIPGIDYRKLHPYLFLKFLLTIYT